MVSSGNNTVSNKRRNKAIAGLDDQVFQDGKRHWRISRLITLASVLKPFKMPLKHLYVYNVYPRPDTTREFVEDVRKVNNADLSCPIILDDEGYVMDGRHRIMKSLLQGKKKILAVRFKETPPPCYTVDED